MKNNLDQLNKNNNSSTQVSILNETAILKLINPFKLMTCSCGGGASRHVP